MTCYLRLHEVAVAVRVDPDSPTDWDDVGRRWRDAHGVEGRDAALDAMPVAMIEMDDLPDVDLGGYAGLVLAGRSDQRLLADMADRLAGLLDRRGVVAFSGQLAAGWLPGTTPFERTPDPGLLGAPELAEHPVFSGVRPADLGASFLYRDGWHRPPTGAEVIARRADGTPGAFVARTGGGTVLVHGGHNLLAYGTHNSSAAGIVPGLVEWISAEAAR